MSYFDNLRVIASGGGSDQARACREKKCPRRDDDWSEDEEKNGGGKKNMNNKITIAELYRRLDAAIENGEISEKEARQIYRVMIKEGEKAEFELLEGAK